MLNFREFDAGPDPFGRKYAVTLKWLQTAISLRHADAVDVKFILTAEDGSKTEKTISLPHPDLRAVSAETGRPVDDAWCGRLAALHLCELVQTGQDLEKELVTTRLADLRRHAGELARLESAQSKAF